MDLIQVDHVVEAVMSYYSEGFLPTIGEPKHIYEPKNAQNSSPPTFARAPLLPPKTQTDEQKRPPLELEPKMVTKREETVLDNPIIGGKYTVFVLCYGDHVDLACRCIDSILSTVDRERIDLRIGTNSVSQDTIRYLHSTEPDKLYMNQENRFKYPVMRSMFFDPNAPIKTNYIIWFDDDTYVVDKNWLDKLTECITTHHYHGYRLFGKRMQHDIQMYAKDGHNPKKWFQEAIWWKNESFYARGSERKAPNGSVIPFAAGWFWALDAEVLRTCNIPDVRLEHNGGDITIGAQVLQGGYLVKAFNQNKEAIFTPSKMMGGRRGFEQSFPWTDPAHQFAGYYPVKG
jgi:hypothetical protein